MATVKRTVKCFTFYIRNVGALKTPPGRSMVFRFPHDFNKRCFVIRTVSGSPSRAAPVPRAGPAPPTDPPEGATGPSGGAAAAGRWRPPRCARERAVAVRARPRGSPCSTGGGHQPPSPPDARSRLPGFRDRAAAAPVAPPHPARAGGGSIAGRAVRAAGSTAAASAV